MGPGLLQLPHPADTVVVLFGFHPAQLSAGHWRRFASRGLYGVPVTATPTGAAGRHAFKALARLPDKPALLCHLDVDAIDYASFPLADCPATTVACRCQTPSTPSERSRGTPGWPA
jgi:hypothetical protein